MKRAGHVIFASDDNGFLQLAVALYSLLSTADRERPLTVSVLTGCGALSKAHCDGLRKIASGFGFARLEIVDVDARLKEKWDILHRPGSQWGVMIWARCLIGEVFPKEDGPIVYLDIDTLVCRDLGELYDMDMSKDGSQPLVLGAVCEECRESGARHDPIWSCGLLDERAQRYFNSGFLVMNATAFRDERLWERIVGWYAEHRQEVVRPDQDALNCLFWDRTRFMHPRYNHCDGWLERQAKQSVGARYWRGNAPREVLEAIESPAVLHFWGAKKPWRWNHRPEGRRYAGVMRAAGLCEGALPGTTAFRILEGWVFRVYHALLRRQVSRRLKSLIFPNTQVNNK